MRRRFFRSRILPTLFLIGMLSGCATDRHLGYPLSLEPGLVIDDFRTLRRTVPPQHPSAQPQALQDRINRHIPLDMQVMHQFESLWGNTFSSTASASSTSEAPVVLHPTPEGNQHSFNGSFANPSSVEVLHDPAIRSSASDRSSFPTAGDLPPPDSSPPFSGTGIRRPIATSIPSTNSSPVPHRHVERNSRSNSNSNFDRLLKSNPTEKTFGPRVPDSELFFGPSEENRTYREQEIEEHSDLRSYPETDDRKRLRDERTESPSSNMQIHNSQRSNAVHDQNVTSTVPSSAAQDESSVLVQHATQPKRDRRLSLNTRRLNATLKSTRHTGSLSVLWEHRYESGNRKPIATWKFGQGPYRILMMGSLDGTEPSTGKLFSQMPQHLSEWKALVLDQTTLLVVPFPNPDGIENKTTGNARQINLNRNFPSLFPLDTQSSGVRSPLTTNRKAGSEVETKVLMRLMRDFRPHRVVLLNQTNLQETQITYNFKCKELVSKIPTSFRIQRVPLQEKQKAGSLEAYVSLFLKQQMVTLSLPQRDVNNASVAQLWGTWQHLILWAMEPNENLQRKSPIAFESEF